MATIKGCVNPDCIANQKKVRYKKTDRYCTKCGEKLQYVCADCLTQLPDDSKKYCIACQAVHKDKRDRTVKAFKKVGTGVLAVGSVVLAAGKTVLDVVKKT